MTRSVLGPLAANMSKTVEEEHSFYAVLRVLMIAFIKGTAPIMAVEMGPSGVLVNAVAPGTIATPMAAAAAASNSSSAFKPSGVSPLGRIGEPDDVADVILFFLSDAAKYVNGTVLPVDGGTRAAFIKT